jgi:hypothetical protein
MQTFLCAVFRSDRLMVFLNLCLNIYIYLCKHLCQYFFLYTSMCTVTDCASCALLTCLMVYKTITDSFHLQKMVTSYLLRALCCTVLRANC